MSDRRELNILAYSLYIRASSRIVYECLFNPIFYLCRQLLALNNKNRRLSTPVMLQCHFIPFNFLNIVYHAVGIQEHQHCVCRNSHTRFELYSVLFDCLRPVPKRPQHACALVFMCVI